MKPCTYYNEFDPYAAQWLRNLIAAGHIASGEVDERSITEVRPDDLRGFTQCHFFAGIGGWSYALRLAGWADDRPVWTGSCPCQPFSAAGKQRGSDDERHLWPAFFDLIRQCRPRAVFGEQVAGAAGYAWWDHVAADLESEGYAAAAADLGAHSVGAPHLRQRLYWMANADGRFRRSREQAQPGVHQGAGHAESAGVLGSVADAERGAAERRRHDMAAAPRGVESQAWERQRVRDESRAGGNAGIVGHADPLGLPGRGDTGSGEAVGVARAQPAGAGADDCLDNAQQPRLEGHGADQGTGREAGRSRPAAGSTAATGVPLPWAELEWLQCSDGKARPTQPGLFPLAHGIPGRVGRLRAYGNAIVPHLAAAFVRAAA